MSQQAETSRAGRPELTGPNEIRSGAEQVQGAKKPEYLHVYTTGPFLLPQNTHSLDWGVLNNDPLPQKIRVTVFKMPDWRHGTQGGRAAGASGDDPAAG